MTQETTTQREVSPVNKTMFKATGATPVQGDAPGTSNMADISLEDLGKLSDFPNPPHAAQNPDDGTGEYVVVLADYLSGADEYTFTKGHVRRLSLIIQDYDKEPNRDIIKGRIKRFFEIKAIRLASPEEKGQDRVAVTVESESKSVTEERNKRIMVENENEVLRTALANATSAAQDATPNTAGQSAAAQTAVVNSTPAEGQEADPFDA